jgi:DNA-binding transcriptional MocR family regulator
MLAAETRRLGTESVCASPSEGVQRLRAAIARRTLAMGCSLAPKDIVITSGCMEAITLALQSVCKPDDTVAIASPVFYTFSTPSSGWGSRLWRFRPARAKD